MRRVKITTEDRETEAEIRTNGGSLTAAEIAHTRVYERVGYGHGRLTPKLREWLGEGGYRAADGSLYRLRVGEVGHDE